MQLRTRVVLSALSVVSVAGAAGSRQVTAQDLEEKPCSYSGFIECRLEEPCLEWKGNLCVKKGPLEWVKTDKL
jgi:hypothetical protein